MIGIVLAACTALHVASSLPPDKVPVHIIKTRSIDLNNAHGLSMETRLEKSVEPTGYRLDLEPYLEDGVYKGNVAINITWTADSSEITLHSAHEIEISEYSLLLVGDNKESKKVAVTKLDMNPKKPIATLVLERAVPKGSKGVLQFSFKNNFEMSSTEAFFKTTYMTDQEVERIVAGTQLRPNNARRMFPCFDEPGYKTPFELSVVRPRNMVALSNMPVARTENIHDEPDAVIDYFERTPPMSTFTLGLVIADLKQLGNSSQYKDSLGNNIEIRVWGRPEYLEALEGVNERVYRVYKNLADIWQVPLPLPRLDIVALPNYQGAKPADNWGLIVFKESDLSGKGYLQLAQELSYQWLGAFATPAWWSDAHLNKAIISYISATTAFKSSLGDGYRTRETEDTACIIMSIFKWIMGQANLELKHTIIVYDQYENIKQMQINNGSEMEGKWPLTVLYSLYYEFSKRYPHSRITGMKQETACTKIELLFRMFNYTLGDLTFKQAIRLFIEDKQFKTFNGDDMWDSINSAAIEYRRIPEAVNIKTVAKSWIDKDRLPLVTVKRDYESKTALVTQKVYLRERPHDVPEAAKMSWWIPLVVTQEGKLDMKDTKPVAWMKDKELKISNMPDKDKLIIVNPEEIGPFPVNYDQENWILLSKFLQSDKRTQIPELTRAKLLHDAWNLAYAGELSFATAFNMTLFLKNERHHLVWDPVFTMIDHIGRHICQCLQPKFQAYVRILLSPLYEELSKNEKEDEETWKKNLRSYTKSFLCKAGYKPCIKEAQEQYKVKWMQAKNPDEGNPLSNQYLCPVFRWGTMKEWEFGLQRVINFPPSRKQSERTYLLKTLAGCPQSEAKINRILNITMIEGNGNFSETDLFLITSMLTGSSAGFTTLFHFVNNNWEVIKEKYSSHTNFWDSLITSATSEFTTEEGLELVSHLYLSHQGEFGSAEHIIEKSMRNIREEAKWSAENLPVIDNWLGAYLADNSGKDDKFIDN